MPKKMMILKGIRHLLDVNSAKEFAKYFEFEPLVLEESGENYADNPQQKAGIAAIQKDSAITAIYGFSGGGYNTRKIFKNLPDEKKKQITRIDVLGSPGVNKSDFPNVDLVHIVPNSPKGHMDTPRWYLEQVKGGKYA